MNSVTFSLGSVALIDKVDAAFGFFGFLFGGVAGKAKHLRETAKLLVANRLDRCVSISRLTEIYPEEMLRMLGFGETPSERSLFRDLERMGARCQLILERYQALISAHGLASDRQFIDFSSSYFEGSSAEMGMLGYSRDHEPGKRQITFGISTGMNGIPSALTMQKGNVNDKRHFKSTLRLARNVLEPGSILISGCGANTARNKGKVRKAGFHYLTMKAKKRAGYAPYIRLFNRSERQAFVINGVVYACAGIAEECGEEAKYVFFSEKLMREQLEKKRRKLAGELGRNDVRLRKAKRGKELARWVSREGWIVAKGSVQKTVAWENPYVTGLEGYFILESSVDAEPEAVLRLYKQKDRAGKLIRDMKEGTELRPIRHWSRKAVIGSLLTVFLTNCLINLTLFLNKRQEAGNRDSAVQEAGRQETRTVKNAKLLKKYLMNLTLTVVYPGNAFRFTVMSNVSREIRAILGDFILRYEDRSLKLRW